MPDDFTADRDFRVAYPLSAIYEGAVQVSHPWGAQTFCAISHSNCDVVQPVERPANFFLAAQFAIGQLYSDQSLMTWRVQFQNGDGQSN